MAGLLFLILGRAQSRRMGKKGLVRPGPAWALGGGLSLVLALVAKALSDSVRGGEAYVALGLSLILFFAGLALFGVHRLFRLRLAGSSLEFASPQGVSRVPLEGLASVRDLAPIPFLRFATVSGRIHYFPSHARGLGPLLEVLRARGLVSSPSAPGGH